MEATVQRLILGFFIALFAAGLNHSCAMQFNLEQQRALIERNCLMRDQVAAIPKLGPGVNP
jgi:hypothetical protein